MGYGAGRHVDCRRNDGEKSSTAAPRLLHRVGVPIHYASAANERRLSTLWTIPQRKNHLGPVQLLSRVRLAARLFNLARRDLLFARRGLLRCLSPASRKNRAPGIAL